MSDEKPEKNHDDGGEEEEEDEEDLEKLQAEIAVSLLHSLRQ